MLAACLGSIRRLWGGFDGSASGDLLGADLVEAEALVEDVAEAGATFVQRAVVKDVVIDSDAAYHCVEYEQDRKAYTATSRWVVDASGRGTVLGRQLKLKKKDAIFNQSAVHAWFESPSADA